MKTTNFKLLLTITIMFCLKTNAQITDYVVTGSNDTIYVDKVWIKRDYIKVKKNRKKIKYQLEKIKSLYKSKDKSYYEKVLPIYSWTKANEKFMQRLTNGKIKFYFNYVGDGGKGNPTLEYFLKKNGVVKQLSFVNYKFRKQTFKEISSFVKDNVEILTELNLIEKLKRENIIDLINKYNSKLND